MSTFTTSDLFGDFRAQGHNRRTRNAWDCGVERGALGKELIYQRSSADFANAELAGAEIARARIARGDRWRCDHCGTEHPRAEAPEGGTP